MKLFDLKGDVAVVIGATGVLGGALAEGLAEAGAKVAVLGRNAERGESRVKRIKGLGGAGAFFGVDAQSRASLRAAHEQITRSLGAPTILVNAAGGNDPKVTVTPERSFEQIAVEDWAANFDLNSGPPWPSGAGEASLTSRVFPRTCRCRASWPIPPRRPRC
jgi:NAD(P)-dependent dehydrogenase (short-subunit alcohol dehydrogenase family)